MFPQVLWQIGLPSSGAILGEGKNQGVLGVLAAKVVSLEVEVESLGVYGKGITEN